MFDELQRMDYDVRQAKRANAWMLHGDWRFKGADPTVELADFTPTDEQYGATLAKISAKASIAPPTAYASPEAKRPTEPMATPEQIEALRKKINTMFVDSSNK